MLLSGEVLLGDLYRSGFEVVSEHEDADAIIVNTCGFVEDAKTESLEVWGYGGVGRRCGGMRGGVGIGGTGWMGDICVLR